MVGRVIAWILLVLALVSLGRDGIVLFETGAYRATTLKGLWQQISPGSLEAAEAAMAPYVALPLPLLQWPAWAVLGVAGLFVAGIFGRRRKRRWRSGSLG